MEYTIKQVSSLEKVRSTDFSDFKEVRGRKVMRGERVSYQIVVRAPQDMLAVLSAESPDFDVKLFRVKEVYADFPVTEDFESNEDYIIKEPGFIPDVLIPMEESNNNITITKKNAVIWVKFDVPKDINPGKYSVKINFRLRTMFPIITDEFDDSAEFEIDVIDAVVPEQRCVYTRWFYADCIADVHNVEIYSEEHWELIDKYIEKATDSGINMILVPVHTPPLDTEVNTARPCVQLVDIEKVGDTYKFGFERFRRFIDICKKHGVKYYEIAHLFTQWGAKSAPNIEVTENGKKTLMFGWHVDAGSYLYVGFLKQYIKAVHDALEEEGIADNAYFHVSDEPTLENMDAYAAAQNIIKPLIGNSKTLDALSHVEFYEKGLVQYPVTAIAEMNKFLEYNIDTQWTYYCCGPQQVYPNSFIAMPSSRVRILGLMLYKFNVKGFLHWGFNFYNSARSRYNINPYLTTSADGAFPSGDGYIVYPGKNGAYASIRGEITRQAFEDMNICFALEALIGKEAVVAMIDKAAGRDLKFDDYPSDNDFLENLRLEMIEAIAVHSNASI